MVHPISIEHRSGIQYPKQKEFLDENNVIFGMLRETFFRMQLDTFNYGTEVWNPLGKYIGPGNIVLIKPNLVMDYNMGGYGEDCLYTHPSVVAAVVIYVWKALKGKGQIIVADAPVQSCDFDKLVNNSGYKKLVEDLKQKGISIQLKDLRGVISHYEKGILKYHESSTVGEIIDLGDVSEHAHLNSSSIAKERITNYNPDELKKHHNDLKHEYCIAKDVLKADVIINMPKPKTHRKAGVTIGMKNLIGVNVRKEYLPHHRKGDAQSGGDEYKNKSFLLQLCAASTDKQCYYASKNLFWRASFFRYISSLLSHLDGILGVKEDYREGSWYGNDTIWRTILDVNRIVLYADKTGKLCDKPQRVLLTIADMIIVGEKEGPMLPSPKYGGVIAMGENVACFDEVIAAIMGMDYEKIPLLKNVRKDNKYPLAADEESAIILSNDLVWNEKRAKDIKREESLEMEPSSGWKGHIEL